MEGAIKCRNKYCALSYLSFAIRVLPGYFTSDEGDSIQYYKISHNIKEALSAIHCLEIFKWLIGI